MAQNFPNSPTNGDTTVINGITYTYVSASSKWRATQVGGSGAGSGGSGTTTYATAAELPLTGNAAGDQAFVSGNNRLYIWNGTGWYNIALINANPSITSVQDAINGTSPFVLTTDGTATVITITASDPEEVPLTYSYSVTSGSLTNGGGTTATVSQGTGANTNVFTITPTTNLDYSGTFTLTFTASDGINQATSVASFSLAFTIDNSKYSAFLLKADNTATDNQVDASSNSLTITENGNVTSTAFSPYHPKGYSVLFDGTDDYLVIGDGSSTGYIELSGDFTIEAFIWSNGDFSSQNNVLGSDLSFEGNYQVYVSSTFNLSIYDNSTSYSSTGTVPQDEWAHIAITRSGSTITYWINGSSAGTSTLSTTLKYRTVGGLYRSINPVIYNSFDGYISNVRIVDGTAIYTTTFTPPIKALTNVTNTAWLVCHLPYLADGSSNGYSVTANGDAHTVLFSPFDHGAYSTTSHRGSVYFDGTGDYLSCGSGSQFDMGTGDFTWEAWVYPMAASRSQQIISVGDSNSTIDGLYFRSTDKFAFYGSGTLYLEDASTSALNIWYHVAVVRSGSNLALYVNGTSVATGTTSNSIGSASEGCYVGTNKGLTTQDWKGYISDARVVKGTAVYTADFTPPTVPLTAITNTQLLTCTNKNSVWDAATGSVNLLPSGGTLSTSITKYENESIQLDGVDDYIAIDYNDPLFDVSTGDFTWEGWFRFNNVESSPKIFISLASGTVYWQLYAYQAKLTLRVDSSATVYGQAATVLGNSTWYHIALVREGSTFTVYQDGISVVTDTYSGSIGNHVSYGIGGPSTRLDGNVEGVRLSKYARYTSNFTPPTGSLEG